MKKYRAFIVLFLILILPPVIYGLMKLLSVQHYRPIENISEKIPNPDPSGPDSVFKSIAPYTFEAQGGKSISIDSLRGKIWVCNIFYTRCTEVCDRVHSTISRLQSDYVSSPEVRFLSISIDPTHDDAAALDAYAKRMEANPDRWYLVRGDSATLPAFLEKELRFAPETIDTISYGMMETSLRLIDWNGHFRGDIYNAMMEDQTVRLAQHLDLLHKEWKERQDSIAAIKH